MSKQNARTGVFPVIPSQQNLDRSVALRQRPASGGWPLWTVLSGILGIGARSGPVRFEAALERPAHDPSGAVPAAFEQDIPDVGQDDGTPAPSRFPYKG